jgi:O-antigen ligase
VKFERLKSYSLVFLLLFFSGNPLATFLFGKFSAIAGLLITFIILNKDLKIERKFLQKYRLVLTGILFIAFLQYLTLPVVSILAIANLLLKILLGGFIFWHLKTQFPFLLFKVLGILSIISVALFFIINIFGYSLPHISTGLEVDSYIIYNLPNVHLTRNSGMFWEPGAFAGILTLCLALNLNNLTVYWNKNKLSLISIIIALLTTQSTTGYLVGFLILVFVFLKPRHFGISLVLLPLLISGAFFVYETNEFLKEKITYQLEKSKSQEVGDFSNTRFGSIIFDWHYIQKHPFIGNGFDERTRYSDHRYLFVGAQGDVIGSGNSFSHYWASMGIFFIIGFFILLWKAVVPQGKLYALLILAVVILNLQGEQWFNFPLYLGLIFIVVPESSKAKLAYYIKTS